MKVSKKQIEDLIKNMTKVQNKCQIKDCAKCKEIEGMLSLAEAIVNGKYSK